MLHSLFPLQIAIIWCIFSFNSIEFMTRLAFKNSLLCHTFQYIKRYLFLINSKNKPKIFFWFKFHCKAKKKTVFITLNDVFVLIFYFWKILNWKISRGMVKNKWFKWEFSGKTMIRVDYANVNITQPIR